MGEGYLRKIWRRIVQKLKIIRGNILSFLSVREIVNCPKCSKNAMLYDEEPGFHIKCLYCGYVGEVDDDYFL